MISVHRYSLAVYVLLGIIVASCTPNREMPTRSSDSLAAEEELRPQIASKLTQNTLQDCSTCRVVFLAERFKSSIIYSAKPDGTDTTILLDTSLTPGNKIIKDYSISYDGSLLSILLAGDPRLYWINPLDSNPVWLYTWLPPEAFPDRVSCSPNGQKILVEYRTFDDRTGEDTQLIGLVDLISPEFSTIASGYHASWKSDNTSFVYVRGNGSIVQIKPDTQVDSFLLEPGRLLLNPGRNSTPMFSIDQRSLIFVSHGSWETSSITGPIAEESTLFLLDIYKKQITRLTNGQNSVRNPYFYSPSGVVVFQREGNLYYTDLNGNESPILNDIFNDVYRPIWLSDTFDPIPTDLVKSVTPETYEERARRNLNDLGYQVSSGNYLSAVVEGNLHVINLFLTAGMSADFYAHDKDGPVTSALFLAVRFGHTSLVRSLLNNGARTNVGYNYPGRTALMEAAARGYNDIIQLLIDHGAIIDRRDIDGRTALSMAIENGHSGTIRLLLQLGAS